jgi:hypothetical protein
MTVLPRHIGKILALSVLFTFFLLGSRPGRSNILSAHRPATVADTIGWE